MERKKRGRDEKRETDYFNGFFLFCTAGIIQPGLAASSGDKPGIGIFPGNVRLVLPRFIYGVVGMEMNIYFDNVVQVINPNNYAFIVTCGNGRKGIQQAERWTFVPKNEDVGNIPFQIEVRDQDNTVVARAGSTIRILPADAGADRDVTMLCVGDSLTYQAVYVQHMLELCQGSGGNPRLTLIGSIQGEGAPESVRLEGNPGRNTEWFATKYDSWARKGTWQERAGSPFIYLDSDNKPGLDFARYCRETNQGKYPDVVTFFLGICDIHPSTDDNIEAQVETTLKSYDILIEMVRSARKDTIIGVVLIPPPAASQDAFGANYGCVYNFWQYKRNQHQLVERLIEHFDGREKEGIFLIPVYVNLDCQHNYPRNNAPWNSRTAQQAIRLVNAVHPSPEGYRQIGDSFYFWLKAVLSGPEAKE